MSSFGQTEVPWLLPASSGGYVVATVVIAMLASVALSKIVSSSRKGVRAVEPTRSLLSLVQPIFKFILAVVNYCRSWEYLFRGQKIIQHKYDQSNRQPFEIHAPDNRYVFVSSPDHIKEVDQAPDTVLSLHAATKQMLQPMYTMQNFNWFDRRGIDGVGFVRAIRTLLTNNLPQILPDLSAIIGSRLEEMGDSYPTVNGTKQYPVYPAVVKLVVLSNAVSFFDKHLGMALPPMIQIQMQELTIYPAKNDGFMVSAWEFIEETVICAEIIRVLPKFIRPETNTLLPEQAPTILTLEFSVIGSILGHRLAAQDVIYNTLLPIAEQRVVERDLKAIGQVVPEHADCIQWILDTSPRQNPWSAKRVVHELMAIWFGSVHTVSALRPPINGLTTVTFAIHDLCLYPEYVEPLRAELRAEFTAFERTGKGLPLLDSFIRESARLSPVEARELFHPYHLSLIAKEKAIIRQIANLPILSESTRRSALQPFTFSNGLKLEVGDWACTPVRAIMQDPEYYPNPLRFNGFRFPNPSKLTDVGNTFHVWGTGRMACPGRFYAAAIMKVITGQVILKYDTELIPGKGNRFFAWRSAILPKSSIRVAFKPVETEMINCD
uniref:Cytochrome P450 n=2 Tax=Bionectria ochroleuca TaxID=29856 RepID=A0A0B7KLU2_BIOOC